MPILRVITVLRKCALSGAMNVNVQAELGFRHLCKEGLFLKLCSV